MDPRRVPWSRRPVAWLVAVVVAMGAAILATRPVPLLAASDAGAGDTSTAAATTPTTPAHTPPSTSPTTPPTTVAPSTTVAAVTATTVRPAGPVAVPANPYARERIVRIGSIEIPKLGLVHPVYEGITLNNIDLGPSHWPGSAMPGDVGNAVFAGHRVTHTHPFRHIDRLAHGDEVVFSINGRRSVYAVTGSRVVRPKDMYIVNPTPTATATLFACHPPHSARYRYVVHLALSEGTR